MTEQEKALARAAKAEYMREWRARNPEKAREAVQRAYLRRYLKRHPEKAAELAQSPTEGERAQP